MPSLKTNITEIVTGLGTLGLDSIDAALDGAIPAQLKNVTPAVWLQLQEAWANGQEHGSFTTAWDNGVAFLTSDDGLRHRLPLTIEWKGPHNPPGYDFLPADL